MNAHALERFIESHAVMLPDPFDGAALDVGLLAPLGARLAGYDIVALGEMNHFVHEKSDFRLLLARALLPLGWTDFAEELGWSDGLRIDRFLVSGAEDEFERLPSFGYTGHLRADRDDRPRGILKIESYPTEAFLFEQRRFYRALRNEALRLGLRVRLAGIDVDGLPGGGYEDIAHSIPSHDDAAFRLALHRVPNETARNEAKRLRKARDLVPPHWPADISQCIEMLAESLDYIAMTYSATSYDEVRPGMALRENAMKRRLTEAERKLGTTRLVVMAHALHLAKCDRAIASGGVGPGGNRTASLGDWLVQERGKKVFSVWMIYGGGEDSQPLANLPRSAHFPAYSLNAMLARFGQPLLFFPGDAPGLFKEKCAIGHMYNGLVETSLAVQADAVVFLPAVTPLRDA